MPIELKDSFLGGLDLDSSPYKVAKDWYIDALNITRDSVEANGDLVISNIIGNRVVSHTYPKRTAYVDEDLFYEGRLLNNGDGTQTMTLTFGAIVGVISVNLGYYNGSAWTDISGGTSSPQTYVMPTGSYTYRVTVTTGSGTAVFPLTATTITGRAKIIGMYANALRSTIIFMRWEENLMHGVYEFDKTTRTISKIFENLVDSANVDILSFAENGKITGVAIYPRDSGDLLVFVDSTGKPTIMNIERFKTGQYTPVTRDIIDFAKRPPLQPPTCVYGNDTSIRTNGLRNKFFRFKQQWVFDDDEKSVTSPISTVEIPIKILDETYTSVVTNNNVITLSLDSGPKNVKAVNILVSIADKINEWSDFSLVETYNKADNSIADDIPFSYLFYNNREYPTIDVQESILLYDLVPQLANTVIMPNGNVVLFAGITDGLSRTLTPNVTITINTQVASNGNVGGFNGFVTPATTTFNAIPYITINGTPLVGTVVTIKLKRVSDNALVTCGTYTTVAGDTNYSVITALIANINATGPGNSWQLATRTAFNQFRFDFFAEGSPAIPKYFHDYTDLIITPPGSSTSDVLPTWKWSTSRMIGIAYYDQKGKTNGVLYDAKISFPAYAEDVSHNILLPYINVKIYHTPPDWAYSYQFVITKDLTQYLFWETVTVNTTETDYIYFEVTNFTTNATKNPTTATVLNYSFQDGDRLRLIRRMSDQTVYADTYDASILGLLVDPTINGVAKTGKQFLKIAKVAPFSTVDYTSNNFIIEIYRPVRSAGQNGEEVFYEFGQQFDILNPTTASRVHAGSVSNQDLVGTPAETNLYNGDSYYRTRSIYITTSVTSFNIQDRNVVDFYTSAVSSVDGRPSIIDENKKPEYFGATMRFGQEYQPDTNINGLNRFYPDDFYDCNYAYGSIRRLVAREQTMRVFQEFKTGVISLFSQINSSPNGQVVTVTDKLINPIQYYLGNFGIGTASESLSSYNNADYFHDNNRGVICRLSVDGVIAISIKYKVNSWATEQLPLRIGQYKIYGCYDPKSSNYISALEATGGESAYTLTFDEETNVFESFLSYHPEMMATIGNLLCSAKDGDFYTHDNSVYNNFYGIQYPSSITPIFNDKAQIKKTYNALGFQSEKIWASPTNGDVQTSMINPQTGLRQISQLKTVDFVSEENVWTAAYLRDANSGLAASVALLEGDFLKGVWIKHKFVLASADAVGFVYFVHPYINYSISQRNL